jgi:hypothetical protein
LHHAASYLESMSAMRLPLVVTRLIEGLDGRS